MISCALIGCGRISYKHVEAIYKNRIKLVAICDILEHKMYELIEKTNLQINTPQKYIDYKIMLEEHPEVDFVSIATNSDLHFEIAQYCIRRNFSVLIEKPLALSIGEASLLIEETQKKNVIGMICFQNRYNPAVKETKKALLDNRFGKISHIVLNVRWNRNHEYYSQASWRGTWKKDGGVLMNQCIHGIDLLLWFANSEPVSVCGLISQRNHNYIETEDLGCAIIKFKNGIIGLIEGTSNIYKENLEESICIFGESGTVKISGKSVNCIEKWDFPQKSINDQKISKLNYITENIYGDGHIELYKNMKYSILHKVESDLNLIYGKKQ